MTGQNRAVQWPRRRVLSGGLAVALTPRRAAQAAELHQSALPTGLVGEFQPGPDARNPALLVLGGSEGGRGTAAAGARIFSRLGYSTLGLAYFEEPGLPDTAELVPLEYFTRAIDWLANQPSVDAGRMGIVGGSKGAEAALLIASRDRRIHAVVACAPSSVVWAGVRPMSTVSSWTADGAPVPFAPYDLSAPFRGVRDLYDRSYAKAPPAAAIPVEKINGPVLLVSGGKDELWPSTPMSEALMARLRSSRSRFASAHLPYPEAGHAVFGPPRQPTTGLPAGVDPTEAARGEAWPKILEFLRNSLSESR